MEQRAPRGFQGRLELGNGTRSTPRRSAVRLGALAVVLAAAMGSASEPDFSGGGFVFGLQYGPGLWSFDAATLHERLPNNIADVDAFVNGIKTSHVATLKARYSILGHVSVGADFTVTGWSHGASMGGAGFLAGFLTWHPFELLFQLLKKKPRPVPLDLATSFGVGYGIAGQDRGMDGLLYEWTLDLDFFLAKYFSMGAFVRGVFFAWDKLYIDYFGRAQAGNTITIPHGSGGSMWTFGLTLSFRAGE